MFKGIDYFDIERDLHPVAREVRDRTRAFVDREVIPVIAGHYRDGTFPRHLAVPMGEQGMLGASLRGYGLPGLDSVSYGMLMRELERGDSAIRSFASVQGALVIYPIMAYGSEEQKSRWLPSLASGHAIGCFGLTEPHCGSNPADMRTRAVKRGKAYILDGAKMWITNGSIADLSLVWAMLDGEVRGFLVEKGTPGFSCGEISGKLSFRASNTGTLIMKGARVPVENLLPAAVGISAPLACLEQARFGIAWGVIGAAMACFEEALDYAAMRELFGRPEASYQLTQAKLADMATAITKGQLLAWQLARLRDAGRLRPVQVSMAKRDNVRMALEVARTARGMLGANGISDRFQVMRHMCNLESVETYEGTYEIHTLVVGRDLTGIDAIHGG